MVSSLSVPRALASSNTAMDSSYARTSFARLKSKTRTVLSVAVTANRAPSGLRAIAQGAALALASSNRSVSTLKRKLTLLGGKAYRSAAEAAAGPAGGVAAWSPGSRAEELVALAADLRKLHKWATSNLAPHAAALLDPDHAPAAAAASGAGAEVGAVVADALGAGAAPLLARSEQCWGQIVAAVASRCIKELQQVRGVTASFRMTNKPAPTQPSPFLPSLLKPLKTFLAAHGSQAPDFDAADAAAEGSTEGSTEVSTEGEGGALEWGGGAWVASVLCAVVGRYRSAVSEVMATARTMDEALKKRKGGRQAGLKAVGSGDKLEGLAVEKLSDADKIGLQLWIDADALAEDLRLCFPALGFPAPGEGQGQDSQAARDCRRALEGLLDEVKPFEKFRGRS
mmetsp:Transcript_48026/g.109063  ORF Transcript_48026/g.109063 Transcript_48026/m.109063 type:complete len:398 (+) Transcript_48026:1158-2351(+)